MARTRTRMLERSDNNAKKPSVVREQRDDVEIDEDGGQSMRKDRPTPSARDLKPRGTGSTGLINRIPVVRSIVAYFRGVQAEMRKVTWPTREETTRLTAIVLGVTAAFAIGLGVLDGFLSWWFRQAFHADSEWIFLAVAAAVVVVCSGAYAMLRKHI